MVEVLGESEDSAVGEGLDEFSCICGDGEELVVGGKQDARLVAGTPEGDAAVDAPRATAAVILKRIEGPKQSPRGRLEGL